jgi:hypothetical protein
MTASEQLATLENGRNHECGNRGESRYVYPKCDLIQFKVTFELDPNVQNDFAPRDRVTKLSELHVDYPTKD